MSVAETEGGRPLATENAAMAEDTIVSDFGQTEAKRAALAAEAAREDESGGVTTQRAFVAREARVTDAMREQRAKDADVNTTGDDQHAIEQVRGDAR